MLSEQAEKEFLAGAYSSKLREDLTKIARNRHNPFLVNGQVDVDRFITFLDEFNQFINHHPKPLRKIIDKHMRL